MTATAEQSHDLESRTPELRVLVLKGVGRGPVFCEFASDLHELNSPVPTLENPQKTGKSEAPTQAQMQKVVDTANDIIAKDLPCFRLTMPRKDAEEIYASAM